MLEPLCGLGGTDEPTGAAPRGLGRARLFVDLAHRVAAANRTLLGKNVWLRSVRPFLEDYADNLRNDIAGALHHDRVPDADVLAGDLVLIVQRRILHHDATNSDRLELGNRRERSRAADLDFDIAED